MLPGFWRVLLPIAAVLAVRELGAYSRYSGVPPQALTAHTQMRTYQRLAAHFGRRAIDAEIRYQEVITG